MKRFHTTSVALMGLALSIASLAANAQQNCTRVIINNTGRNLINVESQKIVSPGESIYSNVPCSLLNARYELGVHRYYN